MDYVVDYVENRTLAIYSLNQSGLENSTSLFES